MQGNQIKSLIGASDGFYREMENKCSAQQQKDLSIRSRELRTLLVRRGEEQSHHCLVVNMFNVKQAELKELVCLPNFFQVQIKYSWLSWGWDGEDELPCRSKSFSQIYLVFKYQSNWLDLKD